MGCRCCSGAKLDWEYLLFLIILGASVFAIITAVVKDKKEKVEKIQKEQMV